MVKYNFDEAGAQIIDDAIHHLEFEMTTFENKKSLMGSQSRMEVEHTGKFVGRLCDILSRLRPNCYLEDDTDISGAYMALKSYKSSIETTLLIQSKTPNWTFNPEELKNKIPQIDKELQTIDDLFGVPSFNF